VIHFVPGTFLAASVADFRAQGANPFRELGATRHFAHRKRANVGAAPVEFDAAHHHLDVFFVQAGGRAVFTRFHALMTGFDTALVFFVGHGGSFA
jgi:hypothetical protein